MANFQPVSKITHANKRWKRTSNFSFAMQDTLVPMVAHELPMAVLHLPIGFVKQPNGYTPVAVLGLQPGKNLYVALNGNWIGGYTPATYGNYPFQMALSEDGQQVLVVDEDSGLATDLEGDSFFDDDGQLAEPVRKSMEILAQLHVHRIQTQEICAKLADCNLFIDWPIKMPHELGGKTIKGFYQIDEAALNALPAEKYETLRQGGAILLAYCQLLSMQHLPRLGRLTEAHQKAEQLKSPSPESNLGLEFLNDSGSISFDKL